MSQPVEEPVEITDRKPPLAPTPRVRRLNGFYGSNNSMSEESSPAKEQLLAYFPTLSSNNLILTPTNSSAGSAAVWSNSSTPVASPRVARSSPREVATSMRRINSTSPTDFLVESVCDPKSVIRRKLKMPMCEEEAEVVKEKFTTYDSFDLQDARYSSAEYELPTALLGSYDRDNSLRSLATTSADDKSLYQSSSSFQNSPRSSLGRKRLSGSSSHNSSHSGSISMTKNSPLYAATTRLLSIERDDSLYRAAFYDAMQMEDNASASSPSSCSAAAEPRGEDFVPESSIAFSEVDLAKATFLDAQEQNLQDEERHEEIVSSLQLLSLPSTTSTADVESPTNASLSM